MMPMLTLASRMRQDCDCPHKERRDVACCVVWATQGGRSAFEPIALRCDEWRPPDESGSQNVSEATIREIPEPEQKQPLSRMALRLLLLVVTTLQMVFIVLATVLIVSGVNTHGDGKEYAAVALAIMLLEIPFTIPAFILAFRDKALGIAACMAGFATFAYVLFWVQLYAEVTTRGA